MIDLVCRVIRRPWLAGLELAGLAAPLLLLGPARRSEGSEPPVAAPASVHLSAKALADSRSCGRSGCHPDISAQWGASAHRFSGLDDPWYRASLEHTRLSAGEVAARQCAGCHAPALPATVGAGAPAPSAPPAAGVSCAACHPDAHRPEAAAPAPAATACVRCHQGPAGEPVDGARVPRLFDDTHAWQQDNDANPGKLRFAWQPPACSSCHMPRVRSTDAGRRGGEVHSHRFAAANTALPALRKDGEQLRAVTGFLQNRQVTVDIFAMTRGRGAVAGPASPGGAAEEVYAPLDRLPATVRRGESVRFDVVVQARGLGHRFPGGKSDLSDCWLEVKGVDDQGRVMFWSGRADASSAVDPGAHFLRTVWADDEGGKIERYEVWRARVAAYRQLLEPDAAHVAHFRIDVPRDSGSRLTVTARLQHRKIAWDFHRWVFSQLRQPVPELPIVTLAEGTASLAVIDAGAPLPDMKPVLQPQVDAGRWNAYGLGLGMGGEFLPSRRAFQQALTLAPNSAEAAVGLSLSVQSLSEALELLEKAVAFKPKWAPAHFFLGGAERQASHYEKALAEQRIAR